MEIALALRMIVFPTALRYDTMYSYRDSNKRRDWVAHLQAGAVIGDYRILFRCSNVPPHIYYRVIEIIKANKVRARLTSNTFHLGNWQQPGSPFDLGGKRCRIAEK
nr:anthranilate synthase alpha subunit 2, chloroplastic-like [Tanacetum cinerariifolium]